MRNLFISTAILTLASLTSLDLNAHAEHDKARFVSPEGLDSGRCDNALRPCKSISYAIQQANKGDKVLVASGHYNIESVGELFDLKSGVVPIIGGFNRFDHYQSQSPDINPTYLSGIPAEMVSQLRQQGFTVIADGKSEKKSKVLKQKMAGLKALSQRQSKIDCVDGSASLFPCQNIDLLAHIPVEEFTAVSTDGNDIWGHVDLNTGKEYAIIGLSNGVSVIDVSSPANPVEVGSIKGNSATWRDIKVYQYFDANIGAWQAYAYVTIDGSNSDGLTIVDLNQLPESISLAELNKTVKNTHNVYIANVDYSYNIALPNTTPILQLTGANRANGSFHNYALSNPATIADEGSLPSNGYTHDGTSLFVTDARKDTNCQNSDEFGCTVFVDFNEKEMNIWDMSDTSNLVKLGVGTYSDVSSSNQYVHSGWWSEDKRFIFLQDEFDEFRGGLNSTLRVFNIEDLTNPVQVGQWTGPTRAIDHNGFVRGNRYYMSNYERGLTVLDITDAANPVEVGFFDTFPSANRANFNGAWGVYPYLPSGIILVSDINSGLYILKDNTKTAAQGQLTFSAASVEVAQGQTISIPVERNAMTSAGTVTVDYELLPGSATLDDFVNTTGTLTWVGDDTETKYIDITVHADDSQQESKEIFFVKLTNPTAGATLGQHSYHKVELKGAPRIGAINIESAEFVVAENQTSYSFNILRTGGDETEVSVNYQLIAGTATIDSDVSALSGSLTWADGDTAAKQLTVTLLNDEESEANETFTLQLSANNGTQLGNVSTALFTIRDDESNTAPTLSMGESFEVNTSQSVNISGTATDAENDAISYSWTQTGGATVSLSNANTANASFVAPSSAGDLTFELTATDALGMASSNSVTVKVVAKAVTPTPTNSSSGGGSLSYLSLMLLLLLRQVRRFSK